jgi:hypothetical protein
VPIKNAVLPMSPIGNRTAQSTAGSAQSKASDAQSKPIFASPLKPQPNCNEGCFHEIQGGIQHGSALAKQLIKFP